MVKGYRAGEADAVYDKMVDANRVMSVEYGKLRSAKMHGEFEYVESFWRPIIEEMSKTYLDAANDYERMLSQPKAGAK